MNGPTRCKLNCDMLLNILSGFRHGHSAFATQRHYNYDECNFGSVRRFDFRQSLLGRAE
jgi:hypothetical protein